MQYRLHYRPPDPVWPDGRFAVSRWVRNLGSELCSCDCLACDACDKMGVPGWLHHQGYGDKDSALREIKRLAFIIPRSK